MKNNYSFYSILTAIPVALLVLVGFTGGQTGNFSGSPGDNNQNCTACHAPGANHGGSAALSGVPATYNANQAYNLNLAITGSSVSKFGFNITAEDDSGNKIGTWTTGTGSQLRSGGSGLTHTAAGSSQNNWSFNWTAPASDVGAVTFYYAALQANGASGNSGDQVITGSSNAVLTTIDSKLSDFTLYPTQVMDKVSIALENASAAQIQVYNMQGNLVLESKIQDQNELDVSHLSSGIYITRVMVEDAVSVAKFVKY